MSEIGFKLDVRVRDGLEHIGDDARQGEELGFDGIWNAEINADPFPGLALAAEHTERAEIGPSVAVALARSPMTVAYAAHELQRYSQGRFVLGLGSQIRPHVERRFGMPWGPPAARMRDFVAALRAIWHAWATDEPLDYHGEFYEHTLMIPINCPRAHAYGPPKVFLAANAPKMLRAAGEVADGVFPHVFMTERYLREVVAPAVQAGRAAAGRPEGAVEIAASSFVAFDDDDVEAVRERIAFYASTLAYRPILELHGWGELQTELHAMSKGGQWREMAQLIHDDLLQVMCVVGSPRQIADGLRERFDGVADRLNFYIPGDTPPPVRYADVVNELRSARPPVPTRARA